MSTLDRSNRKASLARPPLRLLTLAGISIAAGCVTVESQSFRVPETDNIDSAKIALDADFSQYDRLQADEMGIYFPQGDNVPAADIVRIRQIFRNAFLAELVDYAIVDESGPGTMKVRASLIDLRRSGDVPPLQRDIQAIAQPGKLVFIMEMRDSLTGRVLARAADSTAAPAFASSDDLKTDWSSVEAAADGWASLFRGFLDENLVR